MPHLKSQLDRTVSDWTNTDFLHVIRCVAAYLIKSPISGDFLEMAIRKSVATVALKRQGSRL